MIITKSSRPVLVLAFALAGGCILTTGGQDDAGDTDTSASNSNSNTNGNTFSTTDATFTGSSGVDATSGVVDDTGVGESTAGPTGECSANVLSDPGFEGGSPSEVWAEMSSQFGSPICDSSCTTEPGAEPYAGSYWAWFGGVEDMPEHASLSQTLTITAADSAYLSFWFEINASAGSGDDVFTVDIDGINLFTASDAEMADFDHYTPLSVDATDFADGNSHTITFSADFPGMGLTNFFLDEVALITCDDSGGTAGSGGTDSGTTAADGSGSGSSGDATGSGTAGASTGSTGA